MSAGPGTAAAATVPTGNLEKGDRLSGYMTKHHRGEETVRARRQRARGFRGLLVLLLAGLLTSLVPLVPLALASPVDPTQVPGSYDNADFDDVVLAVLGIDGVVETGAVVIASVGEVYTAALPDPQSHVLDWHRLRFDRGPPTV
jgi:hypothetical protein